MNKKGFTLIELLAVIVILAIIALIATPIVMNVINTAQTESNARSVERYVSQLELGYAQDMMANPNAASADHEAAATTFASENTNGETVTCTPVWDNGTVTSAECSVGADAGYTYTAGEGASK